MLLKNTTEDVQAGDQLIFDFGDGMQGEAQEFLMHEFNKDGNYTVVLTGIREFCTYETPIQFPVFTLKLPNVITPSLVDDKNDRLIIQYGVSDDGSFDGKTPADFNYKTSIVIYNRWGTVLYQNDDYHYDWKGDGLASGVYYYETTVEDHTTCKSWLHLVR
jgi:hypothetical protein